MLQLILIGVNPLIVLTGLFSEAVVDHFARLTVAQLEAFIAYQLILGQK